MNELVLEGKVYVSSKRAAELTGYAKDYVGQLCREGRVNARLIGRNWYVLKEAINDRKFQLVEDTFEADQEKVPEADTEVVFATEITPEIPLINKLVETRNEVNTSEIDDQQGVIDSIHEAWSSWFLKAEGEAIESPLSAIESSDAEGAEKVNLRKIREYAPVDMRKEEVPQEEILTFKEERPKKSSRKGVSSFLYRGIFTMVALFALVVGFVGSSLFIPQQNVPKQITELAGVAFYTKGE